MQERVFCGNLTVAHLEAIAPFIRGRVVHDLGAGDLLLSHILKINGAAKVIAIDKQPMPNPKMDGVETVQAYFKDVQGPIDVAFISWPVNWACGLDRLASVADTVIYVGTNVNFTACGDTTLWDHLSTREVLYNTFDYPGISVIVYGRGLRKTYSRLPEEIAALGSDKVWLYEDLKMFTRQQ